MVRMSALDALSRLVAQLVQARSSEARDVLTRLHQWADAVAVAPAIEDRHEREPFVQQVRKLQRTISL
jgi:hypothetical protein